MTAQNPWTRAEKAFAAAKKAMIAADRYFNSAAFQYSEGTSREAACVAKLKQRAPVTEPIFNTVFNVVMLVLCVASLAGSTYNPFLYFRF